EDGLSPPVQRRDLLAAGEQPLLDDHEGALERSLRVLLCKTPVQWSACHALSPESAPVQYAVRFAAKMCAIQHLTRCRVVLIASAEAAVHGSRGRRGGCTAAMAARREAPFPIVSGPA